MKKSVILLIILSLVIFIIALNNYSELLDILPFEHEPYNYLSEQFYEALWFALSLAILPWLIFMIRRRLKNRKNEPKK